MLREVQNLIASGVEVEVVEYNNVSNEYTVQRRRLQEICRVHQPGNTTLGTIKVIIEEFHPDAVHLHEFSETFIQDEVANWLFRDDRPYRIIETTHGRHTAPEGKRYRPDAFAFVSRDQVQQFAMLGVESRYVEYYLEKKTRPDRTQALEKLGLNPAKKHILNVGLWTPGKNQGEAIEIARLLPGYEFHFVGNQAGNFAEYWKPLMDIIPVNCRIWGERDDVDSFYSSMDLFLFTSRKELNPLVIKEAVAWQMPVLMHPILPAGQDCDLISFFDGCPGETADLIDEILCPMAAPIKQLCSAR